MIVRQCKPCRLNVFHIFRRKLKKHLSVQCSSRILFFYFVHANTICVTIANHFQIKSHISIATVLSYQQNDIRVQYHNMFASKCIIFIVLCLQNVSWLVFDRFTKIIGFSRTHRKSSEICLKCREKFLIIFRRTFRRTAVHSSRPAVFVFDRKPPELRQIILCDFI